MSYMDNWMYGKAQSTPLNNAMPANNPDPSMWNWDSWLGNDKQAGILPVAANVGSSLMQGWAGLQSLNLAKRQQRFNEGMAATNLANQATLTNQQLYDRQAMLHRTNPTKYESPESYMQKWAVKGTLGG